MRGINPDCKSGLAENVIVGHLIPAGTGMRKYVDLLVGSQDEFDALAESREKAASRKKKELA